MKAVLGSAFGDTDVIVSELSRHTLLDVVEIGRVIKTFSPAHFDFFYGVLTRSGAPFELGRPDAAAGLEARLKDAEAVLQATLGNFYREYRRHILTYTFVDEADCLSESSWALPGVVILNKSLLDDPFRAAEHMLHEAMHQKLFFLQIVGAFFGGFYAAQSSENVAASSPSWHAGNVRFNLARRIAAAHVYIHLTYFYAALLGERDHEEWRITAVECLHRFRELTLTDPEMAVLGSYGRNFMSWLNSLDPDQGSLEMHPEWQAVAADAAYRNLNLTADITLKYD